MDGTGPSFEHTYTTNGVFPAALTVVGRSGRRSAPTVTEIVVGNTPPEVVKALLTIDGGETFDPPWLD